MPDITEVYFSDINSFPTTKMGSINKLITENSLTRLINRLLDIDGYIITDGLSVNSGGGSEIIGNGGEHLKINSNLNINQILLRDDLFEFVIRGYYFSTDFSNLTNMMSDYIRTYTGSSSVGLFARIFIDKTNPDYPELVGQEAYDGMTQEEEANFHGVQFFVCPLNEKPAPYHPNLDNGRGEIEGLGTTYLYFDLMLLEYIKDDDTVSVGTYIPFESLCKFDSHSINIIDGGVLKLNS